MIVPMWAPCSAFSFGDPAPEGPSATWSIFPAFGNRAHPPLEKVKMPKTHFSPVSVTARLCKSVVSALEWNWSYRHQKMREVLPSF